MEWLLHELDEFYVLGIWCRSAECTDDGLKCISGTEWTLPVVTWMWFAFKTAFLKFFSITTEPEIVPHNLGYLFLASIFFFGFWDVVVWFIIDFYSRVIMSVCLPICRWWLRECGICELQYSCRTIYIHTYMEWKFHFGFRIRWLAKIFIKFEIFKNIKWNHYEILCLLVNISAVSIWTTPECFYGSIFHLFSYMNAIFWLIAIDPWQLRLRVIKTNFGQSQNFILIKLLRSYIFCE